MHAVTVSKKKEIRQTERGKEGRQEEKTCGEMPILLRNSEVKGHESGRSWDICGAGSGQWTEVEDVR